MSEAKHYPAPRAQWWTARQRYEVHDAGYATPCWRWLGSLSVWGYGQVNIHADGQQFGRQAHRIFYEHLRGPVPAHLQLDHLCRNRACVNPDHLEPVTPMENMRRSGQAQKPRCVNGHPFDVENTYLHRGRHRVCRQCRRDREAIYAGRKAVAQS